MAVLITLDDLLKGAVDPDKDTLHVINVEASSGAIIPVDNGYMYIGDATGPVTLTYDITDGQAVVSQQASFTVAEHEATLGTARADDIVGGDGGELIESGAGDDIIHAGIGLDTIYGGDGKDEIHGGAGDDVIIGGSGNDILIGDEGNDLIFAGSGTDLVLGGAGNDRIFAGDGDDTISGDDGEDVLLGEAGNDTIMDGAGEDYVDGGDGNDTVVASADRAADSLSGGTGSDTLSYEMSERAVVINVATGTAHGADIGTDTFKGFEVFIGGQGDDTVATGAQSVIMYGGAGEDTFVISLENLDDTAPVRHVVEDFEVGDRVRMSSYDIFEDASATPDFLDQMKVGAVAEASDSAVPIQFRYDADAGKTFMEADFDHDGIIEASVEIDGQHDLQLHHHMFS